jgi:Subtilase family
MLPGVIGGVGAAIAAAMLAVASLALAAPRPPGQTLSPRLTELATSEELRAAPPRKQAARLDVAPEGEGSLLRDGERLVVEVLVAGDAQAAADGLRAAGAEILGISPSYGIVTAAVAPASLQRVARAPGVQAVTEQLAPATSQVGPSTLGGGGPCGAVTSEGDVQLRADEARATYPIAGHGVEVGVVSDSFDTASGTETDAGDDVASGDLPGPGNPCGRPTPVEVLEDLSPANDQIDEGRAMAQLVHDLAPGARLSFATGFTGLFEMADNIRALEGAGATVIVDDVTYFQEPFFQAGPIDNAIEDVTRAGAVYFSSAGNANVRLGGNDIGSWEAPSFRTDGTCPDAVPVPASAEETCLDFDPAAGVDRQFELTVANGGTLNMTLQWAEPWFGIDTDLDFYLLDSAGNLLARSEADNVDGFPIPFEAWDWTNNTGGPPDDVRVVVNRASGGATPRLKLQMRTGDGITFSEYGDPQAPDIAGPTIMGHNGAQGALSVGAVRWNNDDLLEPFSSHGPVTHYFTPVNGAVPAQPRTPLVLAKPDLAATDGAQTTFFSPGPPPFRFFGTSAAAPHAAAVAALQLDATPLAGPGQIKSAQRSTAVPVGTFGQLEAGAGLVDALAAVEVDENGPVTLIDNAPKKKTPKRRATLAFHAEPRASYECKLDRKPWRTCSSGVSYKVKHGKHQFRVRATDQLGNQGPIKGRKWRRVRR